MIVVPLRPRHRNGLEPTQIDQVDVAHPTFPFEQCRSLGENERVGPARPSRLMSNRQFIAVDPIV